MTSPSNLQRAVRVEQAIISFCEATGCGYEDSLGDLLCDLMHWATAAGFTFDAALDRARLHYDAEGGR